MEAETKTPVNFNKVFKLMKMTPQWELLTIATMDLCGCLKEIKNTKDFFEQSLDKIKTLELL
jgi:hypothetical protein